MLRMSGSRYTWASSRFSLDSTHTMIEETATGLQSRTRGVRRYTKGQGTSMKAFRPQLHLAQEIAASLPQAFFHGKSGKVEKKRGKANGRRGRSCVVSWLECFASRALNRRRMRPCVAYHEIRLEVDEARPMVLVMAGLRPGACSSRCMMG
jgi:ribosomal protein L21E